MFSCPLPPSLDRLTRVCWVRAHGKKDNFTLLPLLYSVVRVIWPLGIPLWTDLQPFDPPGPANTIDIRRNAATLPDLTSPLLRILRELYLTISLMFHHFYTANTYQCDCPFSRRATPRNRIKSKSKLSFWDMCNGLSDWFKTQVSNFRAVFALFRWDFIVQLLRMQLTFHQNTNNYSPALRYPFIEVGTLFINIHYST